MQPLKISSWDDLADREPGGAMLEGVDVVVVRYDDDVSVLYGRCLHRGALMADGTISGDNLVCGLHGWDYSFRTGVSSYDNGERLHRFAAWVDDGAVTVTAASAISRSTTSPHSIETSTISPAYPTAASSPDEQPDPRTSEHPPRTDVRSDHLGSIRFGLPTPARLTARAPGRLDR